MIWAQSLSSLNFESRPLGHCFNRLCVILCVDCMWREVYKTVSGFHLTLVWLIAFHGHSPAWCFSSCVLFLKLFCECANDNLENGLFITLSVLTNSVDFCICCPNVLSLPWDITLFFKPNAITFSFSRGLKLTTFVCRVSHGECWNLVKICAHFSLGFLSTIGWHAHTHTYHYSILRFLYSAWVCVLYNRLSTCPAWCGYQ